MQGIIWKLGRVNNMQPAFSQVIQYYDYFYFAKYCYHLKIKTSNIMSSTTQVNIKFDESFKSPPPQDR